MAKAVSKRKRARVVERQAKPRRRASPRKKPVGLAFRLPQGTRPVAYRLHIQVDPQRSAAYTGHVEIDLTLARTTKGLELHAADLHVDSAQVRTARGSLPAQVHAHPERETVEFVLARALPKGRAVLHLSFSGKLRSDLRGFYAASSGERSYAFTQLEAADARRFFPCFDEPSFKAKFTLSVTTHARNEVISNNPKREVVAHDDGTKTVHFSETPKLSTYLVALAVGELAVSEPVFAGPVPIRIVHVPGNEHLTAFALDAARECLLRLSDYFGLPYPYEKLDLVAVPDFEIGAMENAGAVFFRETLLLVDERSVSLAEKKRAAEVICHELAHMWYGNLVTMQWWDDLWLNEAFATWMAFDIVAKWRPEWKMWNDFAHSKSAALQLDALENTHAIYTEVGTPADATENFDLITYEKGAACVRMIERYLGPEVFQRGVRAYIKRHREGNAVAADLWRALSQAAKRDVRSVVKRWVEAPGFPLVRVATHARGKRTELVLEQERFRARGQAKGKGKASTAWPVPWVGLLGHGEHHAHCRHLLTKPRARVALSEKPDFVYGNADEGGFFRPLHAAHDHAALLASLHRLSASERLGLVQHTWANVRAGYAPLEAFVSLLSALHDERDPDVVRALVGPSAQLLDDVASAAGPDVRAAMQTLLAATFVPALQRVGLDSARGDDDDVRVLRAELLVLVGLLAEEPTVCAQAEQRCIAYLQDRTTLDANLTAPILTLGARTADAARLSIYIAAANHDPTPQERRRFRMALGDVRAPALATRVLELALTEAIPTQDVALLLSRMVSNRHAQVRAWDFVRERWPEVRARMPAMLVSRLIEALPALRVDDARKQVAAFFAAHPVPTAVRALRQADERFELDAAFRKRAVPALQRILSARG
jgi:puromycin-sensitive aminopeptidase